MKREVCLKMAFLKNFFKGIVVGIGGIAPGLSGSVLMVILGLYERVVGAVSSIFKHFKKNVLFLFPLLLGMGVGVLLFSKVVDFLLENYAFQTRYAFMGLILGTIPLFYKEVRKNGFAKRYYILMVAAAGLGFFFFGFNRHLFPTITEPNLWQSVLLGVAVAGSSIVPGVDGAAIMSAFGLYELYVRSLAELNLQILIPAAGGLIVGAVVISMVMNLLLKRFYTGVFSTIFGLFLSVIPTVVMQESCVITTASEGFEAVGYAVVGVLISLYLGDVKRNNARLAKLFKRK